MITDLTRAIVHLETAETILEHLNHDTHTRTIATLIEELTPPATQLHLHLSARPQMDQASSRKAAMTRQSKAHTKRAYFCSCGRIVHGNGGKAMHFYILGNQYRGERPGHRKITHDTYNRKFPLWWETPEGNARAYGTEKPSQPPVS